MNLNERLKDISQNDLQSMAGKLAQEIDEQERDRLGKSLCPEGWVDLFDFSPCLSNIVPHLIFRVSSFFNSCWMEHRIYLETHIGNHRICDNSYRITEEAILNAKFDVVEMSIEKLLTDSLRFIKNDPKCKEVVSAEMVTS